MPHLKKKSVSFCFPKKLHGGSREEVRSNLALWNDLPSKSSRNPSSLPYKQLFSPPALKPINWKIDCFMFHPSFLSAHSKSDGSAERGTGKSRERKHRGAHP